MSTEYKVCCACGRVGTRGFTVGLIGRHEGKPKCNAVLACGERIWQQRWGKQAAQ